MNLYFECEMGAAGDMIASALVDLFEDKSGMVAELNALGLPHTEIVCEEKNTGGICGMHLSVVINGEIETPEHHGEHHHHGRSLHEINEIIDSLSVSEKVKTDVKNIYAIVAQAESEAHGTAVGEVHFHELGMLDAVADVTICAYLIEKLNPGRIISSPVNVGNGTVKCAHGELPVPAPATANILRGIPYYKSDIMTELCTPTGAAVLKYYVSEFTQTPHFGAVKKTGTGTGTKELPRPNILRIFEYEDSGITELSCNIDDMTGEEAAFAAEVMMSKGALDCFFSPVFMKKGRPAYLFTVLCKAEQAKDFVALIFKHTTTIGIRKYSPARYTLDREFTEKSGVTVKRSEGYGTRREKPEFEDIKRLALEKDISVFEARELL
ncbi:MAG: nickel pincer cofactor biosynthesis protein LarC [Lachnospiraceae bacterium]|nr:nickel pincer cofactor biosynthesis protein LarC [Lachnospiraceae bacterium]